MHSRNLARSETRGCVKRIFASRGSSNQLRAVSWFFPPGSALEPRAGENVCEPNKPAHSLTLPPFGIRGQPFSSFSGACIDRKDGGLFWRTAVSIACKNNMILASSDHVARGGGNSVSRQKTIAFCLLWLPLTQLGGRQ